VGAGREMNQALYAHMNNKRKMKKIKRGACFIQMPSLKNIKASVLPLHSLPMDFHL
jgi:hypothetical protein